LIKQVKHWVRVRTSLQRERAKTTQRSPHWAAVRDHYLRTHGDCAACGSIIHPQVHHKQPYHLHPELELDPANFITLCMGEHECHLKLGHGDDFKAYNPNVIAHVNDVLVRPNDRGPIEDSARLARRYE
jgi:5-methylcytosine-specific restriction endonuclease McrA